jgi:hypothetical protein
MPSLPQETETETVRETDRETDKVDTLSLLNNLLDTVSNTTIVAVYKTLAVVSHTETPQLVSNIEVLNSIEALCQSIISPRHRDLPVNIPVTRY